MDLAKLAELVKKDTLFKEILYVGLGLVFIFLINIFFFIDVNKIPNYVDLKSAVGIIFIIPVSYFLARICCEIGHVINVLLFFLLKGKWWIQIKKGFDKFYKWAKADTYTPSKEDLEIRSTAEAIEQFKDSIYIKTRFDEARRELLISYGLSGFFIIVAITSLFVHTRLPWEYFVCIELFLIINSSAKNYAYALAARKLVAIAVRRERGESKSVS